MAGIPRVQPFIELRPQQLRAMLLPLLGGGGIRGVARVEGGLVNTIYRVTPDRGDAVYTLRVYAGGTDGFEREHRLLSHLAGVVPAPRVLLADASGRDCGHPYMVYRWIAGTTLDEARGSMPPESLLALAEPLGGVLARVAGASLPPDRVGEAGGGPFRRIAATQRIARAMEHLRAGRARDRLGSALADALRERMAGSVPRIGALESPAALVHGDFGGRNLLVRRADGGGWSIAGVLDWENAAAGSALWDPGNLFRYTRRFSPEFRARFEHGYRGAGGVLPHDWWWAARMLDATRLVAIFAGEREIPGVFAERAELLGALAADREDPGPA
ncbi:MAG TPA: aminoglycoside phosphotransferase family protein [Longimicrobiaceae bacterium]|nr:aminoglycoside phosphotransferase family protein [Longimicrobiaceae bacterium]